jgi:hypothetical protein
MFGIRPFDPGKMKIIPYMKFVGTLLAYAAANRAELLKKNAILLVLCAVVSIMWARGYWRFDQIMLVKKDMYKLASTGGEFSFSWSRRSSISNEWKIDFHSQEQSSLYIQYGTWEELPWRRLFGGFAAHRASDAMSWDRYDVAVPYWPILAALLFNLFRRIHRDKVARERIADLVCISCGYDLRASEKRCPECGTPFCRQGAVSMNAGR